MEEEWGAQESFECVREALESSRRGGVWAARGMRQERTARARALCFNH